MLFEIEEQSLIREWQVSTWKEMKYTIMIEKMKIKLIDSSNHSSRVVNLHITSKESQRR